jgi:dynein light chain LC8-type
MLDFYRMYSKSSSIQKVQATQAIQLCHTECDMAQHVKQFFDAKYGPNWHCIVGRHFAHNHTHDAGSYIFLHVGQTGVLLYRMN